MSFDKFEEKEVIKKLVDLWGKVEVEKVQSLPEEEVVAISRKLISGWVKRQDDNHFGTIGKKIVETLANTGEEEQQNWWEVKRELTDKMESILTPIEERQETIKWLLLVQAIEIVERKWREAAEIWGGLWLVGQITEKEMLNTVIKEAVERNQREQGQQREESKFLEELTGGLNLTAKYKFEVVKTVKCFYKKGDKHKFVPVLAAFPPLSTIDIEKLKMSLPIGLPKEYEEFLTKANGLRLGWSFYWWGARRVYDEIKHLEQNYSLINSRVDEQLVPAIASTEVVIGSDKYRNIFVMDVTNGSIYGIIRPNGDELAEPTRKSFKNLGGLLSWQLEIVEKEDERG